MLMMGQSSDADLQLIDGLFVVVDVFFDGTDCVLDDVDGLFRVIQVQRTLRQLQVLCRVVQPVDVPLHLVALDRHLTHGNGSALRTFL